jgi:hypothetical protein
MTKPGTVRKALRWTALASARVNSALVGVRGAHRLTGPLTAASWPRWIAADTQSRNEITGKNCWPPESRAPRPSLKSGTSCLSGGEVRSKTGTVRITHTRAPASTAGVVAACQSRQTLVMNASPRLSEASVTTSFPWSPYQPRAFWARNAGLPSWAAMARARVLVVEMRLSRRLAAHFFECGLPIVGEPATLTTTSTPSRAEASSRPAAGFHETSSGPLGVDRTSERTSSPFARRPSAR